MNARTRLFLTSRGVVFTCLALAVGYFLVMRHWQHVIEFAPYLILLACPVMHLFGGHGGHGAQRGAHAGHTPGDAKDVVAQGRQQDAR